MKFTFHFIQVTCAHFYSIIMFEIYYNFQLSSLFRFQFGAIQKRKYSKL